MDVCINVFRRKVTNMYIMVNGAKTFLVTKLKEEKTQKKLYDDVACYSTSY